MVRRDKNYSDDTFTTGTDLINTGEYSQTEKNHIFDLAGNLEEWTTEADSSDGRVSRGGVYGNLGSEVPASGRGDISPDNTYDNVGFRVALYL